MFYDKFAALCKQKGVSVSRAAVESGISKSLVTKWKTNRIEVPSPEVLQKLSNYFSVSVADLLGEDDKKELPLSQDALTERERKIIEAVLSMDPGRQKALADLLGVPTE